MPNVNGMARKAKALFMNQSSASDSNSGAAPASQSIIKYLTGALTPYLHILYYALFFILIYALIRLAGIVIYRDVIDFTERSAH